MSEKGYHFSGQKEGERVIALLRRHWITFIGPFLFTAMVFVIPMVVWTYFFLAFEFVTGEIYWVCTIIWALIATFFLLYNWLDWYLDIYIVSNMRIIDITQNGLFHRQVGESPLDNVQDVIYEIKGIVPMIFNYGNVTVHTAGPSGDIVFEQVSAPQDVQRFLLNQAENYKDENNDKAATPEDLLNMMLAHERERLLKQGLVPQAEAVQESPSAPSGAEAVTLSRKP